MSTTVTRPDQLAAGFCGLSRPSEVFAIVCAEDLDQGAVFRASLQDAVGFLVSPEEAEMLFNQLAVRLRRDEAAVPSADASGGSFGVALWEVDGNCSLLIASDTGGNDVAQTFLRELIEDVGVTPYDEFSQSQFDPAAPEGGRAMRSALAALSLPVARPGVSP